MAARSTSALLPYSLLPDSLRLFLNLHCFYRGEANLNLNLDLSLCLSLNLNLDLSLCLSLSLNLNLSLYLSSTSPSSLQMTPVSDDQGLWTKDAP